MSSNDWQEWVVETYSQLVEPLEEWLFAQGALAVSLEDNADEPLLEPGPGETPLWQNIKVTALFSGSLDLAPIKQALPSSLLAGNSRNEISTLQDRDWERVWMEDFTPIQMGPRLWICPSWTPPPDEALNALIAGIGLALTARKPAPPPPAPPIAEPELLIVSRLKPLNDITGPPS